MRHSSVRLGLALSAALAIALAADPALADLSVGDDAPAFDLTGADGRHYTLKGLLAEYQGVVLAWFPKAFTPGCTAELHSLHDNERALADYDVATFMVSLDDPEQNRAFAESVGAGFQLLSDGDKLAAERYGVLAPGGAYTRRVTFYIDAKGKIARIDRDVSAASHGADVARALEELGFPKRISREAQ